MSSTTLSYSQESQQVVAVHLEGLNPSQIEATTQPLESITRVVAGPGAGKTRVLTCRIAELLQQDKDSSSRILAVTFTKKAAGEMQHRLDALLRQQLEENRKNGITNAEALSFGMYEDGSIQQEEAPPVEDSVARPPKSPLMDRVTLGTFHSVCAKILRWNGQALASLPSILQSVNNDAAKGGNSTLYPTLDGSFAIADQSEQMSIVKECLKLAEINLKGSGGKKDIRPITILNAVSQLKSDDILACTGPLDAHDEPTKKDDNAAKMTERVREIAEKIYPMYRAKLLSQNSLDFDDLILLARELLLTNPTVRQRLHRRWTHVLVDEFQDTSRAQLDLVKLLTTRSLFVVGDGDQSIYSWRGANVESMSDFVKEFNGHRALQGFRSGERLDAPICETSDEVSVNTVYLMENYRSTTNIVNAAQKIISGSEETSSAQSAIRQDMKPMRGKGPTPRVIACPDSQAEASRVVQTIHKMAADGELSPASSIALIYRTNAQSRALEEACVAQNLHYLVRGSAGTFYSRAEVKDCLCFLRCLYNGRDRAALIRAFKTPSRGIGEVAVKEFFAYCDEVDSFRSEHFPDEPRPTPFDVLISLSDGVVETDHPPPEHFVSKRALNRIVPFSSQMKLIQRKAEAQTVSDLLATIIDTLNLKAHFDSISKTSTEFADRMGNVMELCSAAERYVEDGPSLPVGEDSELVSPLGLFLDDVSLLSETNDDDSTQSNNENRLVANLMTIHASKGMEFDAVFLVGNEEGTFPTHRAISEGEGSVELDEERRLCYVAMTRAKTHLILTWRREVMAFFGAGFKVIVTERSRFLDTLVASKPSKSPRKAAKVSQGGGAVAGVRSKINPNRKVVQGPAGSSKKTIQAILPNSSQGGVRHVSSSTNHTTRAHATRSSPMRNSAGNPKAAAIEKSRRTVSTRRPHIGSSKHTNTDPSTWVQATRPSQRDAAFPTGNPKASSIGSSQWRTKRVRNNGSSQPKSDCAPAAVDSTWFFPVGSAVRHAFHGGGVVLDPRNSGMVRVELESGREIEISVDDNDLLPSL